MKKYIVYIVLLLIGLLLGGMFFGKSSRDTHTETHQKTDEKHMWTCSMHPQIMQPEKGDCPICGMDLIPAEVGAEGLTAVQFKMTKTAMALANIQTTTITNKNFNDNELTLSGKIEVNENSNKVITAHFNGRVEKLYINYEGEEIRNGQSLALVYSPELVTAQRELLTSLDLQFSQPELYKAVRHKLKTWDVTDSQIEKIEQTKEVINDFPVYANVGGVVIEKMVEEGDHIVEGKELFKVTNLSSVWAEFDVFENQISSLKKGQLIEITSNAYPGKISKGKISFIDPVLNAKTRTVKARVVLNNKIGEFKPGMFVEGKIKAISLSETQKLSIPSSAVLWTGERSIVYLKAKDNPPVFEMREVILGNKIGNNYEVIKGLYNGDEIVTNGTFTVDAAAQLQGKKSMMNNMGDMKNMNHQTMMPKADKKFSFDVTFEEGFSKVINTYLELKDAFVKSDVSLVKKDNMLFNNALEKVSHSSRKQLSDSWKLLYNASQKINEGSSINEQRKQFQIISNTLIEIVTNFSQVKKELFVQFCPMANDNKGAYWVSSEKEILNPYFGDLMLNCGNVVKEIN